MPSPFMDIGADDERTVAWRAFNDALLDRLAQLVGEQLRLRPEETTGRHT